MAVSIIITYLKAVSLHLSLHIYAECMLPNSSRTESRRSSIIQDTDGRRKKTADETRKLHTHRRRSGD